MREKCIEKVVCEEYAVSEWVEWSEWMKERGIVILNKPNDMNCKLKSRGVDNRYIKEQPRIAVYVLI